MQERAHAAGEESLEARLAREGALSDSDALELVFPLLEAVIAAHAEARVDGALDLARILVRVRTDGGLVARIDQLGARDDARRGRTGALSSPEQGRGAAADERSDQYAVGAILWACLAGRPKIIAGIEPLASVRADVPAELAAVVERATTADPARRHASVRAFADALAEVAPPELRARRQPTRGRSAPRLVAPRTVLGALVLVVAVAIAIVLFASFAGRG